MTETTPGREPVQIVEIKQPICAHVHGSAPCTATATGDGRCFNTRASCQDVANFALGTPISLYFTKPQQSQPPGVYALPFLQSVSTAPTAINLAVSSDNQTGLGVRAVAQITLSDAPHTDRIVDPYLSGRTYDPMSRGSFWTKWLVRNKFRVGMTVVVYEGYVGQSIGAMVSRQYQIDRITGPGPGGTVTIVARDILARLEDRKAKAPTLSPGTVWQDIDATELTLIVQDATTSDYPASGTLRIGEETITYSARSADTSGRITFTITERGSDGTTAEDHSVDDVVQSCLRYTSVRVDTILNDLLASYAGIDASYIPTSAWDAEISAYLNNFTLSSLITEPTSVGQLVSEISEQCALYIFWNERDKEVQLRAIRGIDVQPATISDDANIVMQSFSVSEYPEERVSQIWVHYNQHSPTKSLDDESNFKNVYIKADLSQEAAETYGEPAIRQIFSRWLTTEILAKTLASKVLSRYIDPPRRATLSLDAKDRSIWVGDTIYVDHSLDVDEFGERRARLWTVTSAEETLPGEQVKYLIEDTTLYGQIAVVMEDTDPDYQGDGSDQFDGMWISRADGTYTNGDAAARITS